MQTIYLYSTPGCHLCDLARDIISPLLTEYSLYLTEVDIAASDELIERYGVRIPVLKSPRHIAELGWPFDSAQAADFLHRINV
jgi:hypothetical protein